MRVISFTINTLLLLATFAAQAQFDSVANNGAVTITAYNGPGGAVIIPTNLNSLPVTSIGGAAFYERYDVTSLDIPDTVTNIGEYAFYDCADLTSVTMPAGLISIGDDAFEGCSSLTSLVMPSNVACVGSEVFGYCSSLTSVTLSPGLTNIGFSEFTGCASLTNVTIPNYIASIGEYAFSGCTRLTSVNIPGCVTNIGYGAFLKCAGLTSITIPNSVTNIGQYAFYNCSNLTSVYFNGSVPNADLTVFASDKTTAYYLPGANGWTSSFGGAPTAFWTLPYPMILNNSPGVNLQNQQFGFTISWATNRSVVIEACANMANPVWAPIATNTFTNGLSYFNDPNSPNIPACFYRVTIPSP